MTDGCALCGALRRLFGHHVFGRAADGSYVSEFLADLCGPCHGQQHHVWRILGLDTTSRGDDQAKALLRFVVFVESVADRDRLLLLSPVELRAIASGIRACAAESGESGP
jgi:hypothetical protein